MARSQPIELPAPPALTEWQKKESKWKAEAQAWVKERLMAYFETEASYHARTTSEIMLSVLDTDASMPTGYARITDRNGYAERYALVRNTLEGMARHKLVVVDSTLNSRGKESSAYARPVNAADEWSILVNATDKAVHDRALRGLKEWLSLEGAVLEGVTGVMMTKKPGGSREYGQTTEAAAPIDGARRRNTSPRSGKGPTARRRKPRNTSGGD